MGEINIIVTGDFYLGGRVKELCSQGHHHKIFNDILPFLKCNKDFSITNLECPTYIGDVDIAKCGPRLMAPPECLEAVRFAGFDCVTLANNHIMDQGREGLFETIQACKRVGIKTVGAGRDISEASQPLFIEIKSKNIAILNFSEHEFSIAETNKPGANPLDPVTNYLKIIEARKKADFVFVVIHGGNEFFPLPSPRMVDTYRFFAELGVTAVIGHHTHCSSGYEVYKGVPIFYGLGNFVFDMRNSKYNGWSKGYFVKFQISNCSITRFKIFPYDQFGDKIGLRSMKDAQKEAFLKEIDDLSDIIKSPRILETKWDEYCDSRREYYLSILLGSGRVKRRLLKANLFSKLILKKHRLLPLSNMFTCEAHRDVMIRTLKNEISKN